MDYNLLTHQSHHYLLNQVNQIFAFVNPYKKNKINIHSITQFVSSIYYF